MCSCVIEQRAEAQKPRDIPKVTAAEQLGLEFSSVPWAVPWSIEGAELPVPFHMCCKIRTLHPHPRPGPGLAFHLTLLLGTTRQKNKALEIEEADDLENSD